MKVLYTENVLSIIYNSCYRHMYVKPTLEKFDYKKHRESRVG
jgi:hypothetical protein